MDLDRCRILNSKNENNSGKYIALYIKKDIRYRDNWSFVLAIRFSKQYNVPIKVFYFLPKILHKNTIASKYCIIYPSKRHLDFLLKSLSDFEIDLNKHGIPLEFKIGNTPLETFESDFNNSVLVITDFKPTIAAFNCDTNIVSKINVKIIQIDSSNIIPIWITSDKAEYMARTIRNKLWTKANKYLINYPNYTSYKQEFIKSNSTLPKITDLQFVEDSFITKTKAGYINGMKRFNHFVKNNLKNYNYRNDPTKEVQSNMSIYINYGSVSVQKIICLLKQISDSNLKNNIDEYIEEIFIRRELAENLCFYKDYTSVNTIAWPWAVKLIKTEKSKKQIFSLKEMECGKTDDIIWNACQYELVNTGYMQGYMRMFWSKKIAEWCKNRQIALDIANYLNDKYQMDGSSSGGYAGNAWCIIGTHDRPFFGKIRQMTLQSLKNKKIDINKYVNKFYKEKISIC